MIKRQKIDGKQASIAYLKDGFVPCGEEEATLVKVVFDDGKTIWLAPKESRPQPKASS